MVRSACKVDLSRLDSVALHVLTLWEPRRATLVERDAKDKMWSGQVNY